MVKVVEHTTTLNIAHQSFNADREELESYRSRPVGRPEDTRRGRIGSVRIQLEGCRVKQKLGNKENEPETTSEKLEL